MINKIFAFILICLMPASSFAITREEAVRYALENSEAIRMVTESSNVLRAGGKQAEAFTDPQAVLNAGHLDMGDNKPENPYFSSPDRDILAEARVSKLLFAGGRIWKTRALAKNFDKQADILETSGKRDIGKQVRMAFDAVLYQKAAIDILEDRVKQRRAELEDAQDLKTVGMVTSLDVRQAKLSVYFGEDRLKDGEASYREALIDFNLAIGRSGDEELLVPEGNLKDVPDLQKIMKQLKASLSEDDFLDITSSEAGVEAARLNYEIACGERWPEVVFAASGKSNGEKPDEMDESWTIGVQASWSILDGGLVRAKKASARSEMQKAEDGLSQTRKSLAGEVEKIGVSIRSLEERIRLQQEAVELSRKNYEDARGHYRAGTITLTRLGEFNLSYAEARFNLLQLFFLKRQEAINADALLEK
ncbi:TolC family protein [Desulfococcaceae bacterium HSG8]|nr:TolC family protein [Desulfococcaceae bacterium HSG8]